MEARLGPGRVAPPALVSTEAEVDHPLTARATVMLPEDAAWDQWTGFGYRLFNNRAALLLQVRIEGTGRLTWIVEDTLVELNTPETALSPSRAPDELLVPLLQAALLQEQWHLEGDLVERTRAAGPFRSAYLPVSPQQDVLEGLIAFPLQDPSQQIAAMRLTVGVRTESGPVQVVWVFE